MTTTTTPQQTADQFLRPKTLKSEYITYERRNKNQPTLIHREEQKEQHQQQQSKCKTFH